MIGGALASGLHPRWVLGDEVYGNDSKTRHFLESRGQPYVLAVGSQQRLWQNFKQQRVDKIARDVPEDAWHRLTIAQGTKGPRVYDWAASTFGAPTETGLRHWLLVRRSIHRPPEHAYYLCAAPPETTVCDLAMAAGQRWAIETCFETAKQETGLDEYEVRSWTGWYRHITLSMLALSFWAVVRAAVFEPGKKNVMTWSR